MECLPKDIPDKITIDITDLQIGSSYHVRDLKVEDIRIMDDPDKTIITILAPRVEKEPTPVVEGEPVEGEVEKREGEEGAEHAHS